MNSKTIFALCAMVVLACFVFSAGAQEISIPDPGLNAAVDSLRNQGVSVFTYQLTIQLILPRKTPGVAFEFALTGPPGIYTVLSSTNLTTFGTLGTATNTLGSAIFTDTKANLSPQKFYRARAQ